jgi:hypothetical protein
MVFHAEDARVELSFPLLEVVDQELANVVSSRGSKLRFLGVDKVSMAYAVVDWGEF